MSSSNAVVFSRRFDLCAGQKDVTPAQIRSSSRGGTPAFTPERPRYQEAEAGWVFVENGGNCVPYLDPHKHHREGQRAILCCAPAALWGQHSLTFMGLFPVWLDCSHVSYVRGQCPLAFSKVCRWHILKTLSLCLSPHLCAMKVGGRRSPMDKSSCDVLTSQSAKLSSA